jgi:hypothetical protein
MELDINNYNENPTFKVRSLRLDYNPTYGGYRLDYVNTDTSESFFIFSSRMSNKEMSALIQGLISGKHIKGQEIGIF